MGLLADHVIEEEIGLALADAKLTPAQVVVHVHPRQYDSGEGPPSGHFRPHQLADVDDQLGLDTTEVARLNTAGALTLHRIVLFADYEAEPEGRWLFAGLLRHELEHARQWEAHGDAAFLLSRLIDDIHYERFADAPEEKYLYRAKPDEQDANGSAATYLAGRFGDAPASHLHTDRWYPLVWSSKPAEPMETLIVRSVCFLFQYPWLCEVVASKKEKTFADMLEAITPDAAETWRVLGQA